ncbi:PTS sugar transporter subunit IIBC [Pedobacter suwonensis]|uniref:PTS sugar transporter subunit IIBC n=1 Tax=Pedobacter chinensis TaxID=2282421 RepID=A0A369PQ50_9SPHI|nr:PTS sugar transporter subunit IIBC [Pedobacter chinensis]
MDFIDRKVSGSKAIALLAKNGLEVDDEEAMVIMSFLYLVAKIHNRKIVREDVEIRKEKSNKSNSYLA